MRIYLFMFFLTLTLMSCVEAPIPPKNNIGELSEHGAYILCEGLYGQNNSSLNRYDFTNKTVHSNFFQQINGKYIGDTANDIVIKGDTAFIVVSTQKEVIMFNTKTGKLISEILIVEGKYPRKLAVLNDSIILVSDLYAHCLWVINYKTSVIMKNVSTGPAPEGIAICENYIFVANSGFGDYLADEPKAGTISVFDSRTLNGIKSFSHLPNVIELKISTKHQKLYARYNHLPKYTDSLGGIVEFDISNLLETRRWKDRTGQFAFSENEDTLYYNCDDGVKFIDLKSFQAIPELLIHKSMKTDYWYSLAYYKNNLWIGNAKDYQSHGEILIFDVNNPQNLKEKFNVGLNPNTIVFF
ncbi:MAG: hypothetical protein V1779_01035 [bacterium]